MDNNKSFHPLYVATISSLSNILADTLTYPLDLLNTQIKSDFKNSYKDIVKSSYNQLGIRGFFKGSSTILPGTFPPCVIFYWAYENINKKLFNLFRNYHEEKYKSIIPIISSSLSEMLSLTIIVPVDTIQTRIQSHKYPYNNLIDGLKHLIKNEGFVRLYSSSHLMIMQNLLFVSSQFSIYEDMRLKYIDYKANKNHDNSKTINSKESIGMVLIATTISCLICNPINLLVVKYQMIDTNKKDLNLKKIVKGIYDKYGLRGLNRGLWVKTVYYCCNSVIYLPIYEHIRQQYGINLAEL